MIRPLICILLGTLGLAGQPAASQYEVEAIPLGWAKGDFLGQAVPTATGAVLSLVRPGSRQIAVASYDRSDKSWHPSPAGVDCRLPCVAGPEVADDGSTLALVWGEAGAGVRVSFSPDRGGSWTPPQTIDRATPEAVAITALPARGFVASWIRMGRGDAGSEGFDVMAQRLGAGAPAEEVQRVARDAAPGCPLSLQPLADGGAVLAYRSITAGDIHDCSFCRLHGQSWTPAKLICEDQWRNFDQKGAGPKLATDGGRIAALWYTGADADPRFLITASPDAGERFLMPLRVDTESIHSEPAVALLHDGAEIAVWVGAAPGREGLYLQLRRVSPDFALQPPVILGAMDARSRPWAIAAVLTHDYSGGNAQAELLVIASNETEALPRSFLVHIPESQLLAAADTGCHCAPAPSELVGYPFRGEVVGTERGGIRVSHGEIPGVLDEGTSDFIVDITLELALKPGARVLGRIERQGGQWRLYDVRVMGGP